MQHTLLQLRCCISTAFSPWLISTVSSYGNNYTRQAGEMLTRVCVLQDKRRDTHALDEPTNISQFHGYIWHVCGSSTKNAKPCASTWTQLLPRFSVTFRWAGPRRGLLRTLSRICRWSMNDLWNDSQILLMSGRWWKKRENQISNVLQNSQQRAAERPPMRPVWP